MSAFVERRSWAAGLVGLLLGPIAVMLYLGKGRTALGYVALFVGLVAVAHLDLGRSAWVLHFDGRVLNVIGAVHGAWAAMTSTYGRPAE